MKETLYRPHAAEGTHYCDSKDHEGWLKGSTLDDESNKVHGTLDLEPVDVDLDGDGSDVLIIALALAAGAAIHSGWVHRKEIAAWVNRVVIIPAKKCWYKLKGQEFNSEETIDECADNIIVLQDYLGSTEPDDDQPASSFSN